MAELEGIIILKEVSYFNTYWDSPVMLKIAGALVTGEP